MNYYARAIAQIVALDEAMRHDDEDAADAIRDAAERIWYRHLTADERDMVRAFSVALDKLEEKR